MKTLTQLTLLFIFALIFMGCTKEASPVIADPDYTASFSGTLKGFGPLSGELPFCDGGERAQWVHGRQGGGSPYYSSVFGSKFPLIPEVKHVAVRIIGRQAVMDTLDGNVTTPYSSVTERLNGSKDIDTYVDAAFVIDGKRYVTVYEEHKLELIRQLDPIAEAEISTEFLLDGSCRGGDNLIIRSEVRYDGYAYNIYDFSDSIQINDFAATLYNYGL